MSRPLDPSERDNNAVLMERTGSDAGFTLQIAEERRDPRDDPVAGDWLELDGRRWLVLSGDVTVLLERLWHLKRGQHRFLRLKLMAYQKRFAAAVVLGKRTNAVTRAAKAKEMRLARDAARKASLLDLYFNETEPPSENCSTTAAQPKE